MMQTANFEVVSGSSVWIKQRLNLSPLAVLRYVTFCSTINLKHKACEQIILIVWCRHKLDIRIRQNNEDI